MINFKKYFYLKLDGFYYDKKLRSTMIVLRFKHKRTVEIETIKNILNNSDYFYELPQIDWCLIGLLANHERSNFIYPNSIGWANMKRARKLYDLYKYKQILEISHKYTDENYENVCILKPTIINNFIKIKSLALWDNNVLMSQLKYKDAISLGYTISDILLNKKINEYSI